MVLNLEDRIDVRQKESLANSQTKQNHTLSLDTIDTKISKGEKKFHDALFLGKFAPLHKGHEYVIQTALAESKNVHVLIYDSPDATKIPLSTRANWIRELYPSVNVIEGWASPQDTGYTQEIIDKQNKYITRMLEGTVIDAFYSSEKYGEHVSQILHAHNRVVDMKRTTIPISATQVRKSPFEAKEFLSDTVYRSLVTNVVLLGGPSTGKSTLAKALAKEYNTEWMPEYGREYWEKHQKNHRLTKREMLEIAKGHLKREDDALVRANKYLFTDTNALTTYLFGMWYHKETLPKLKTMAKDCFKRYDVVLLCDNDIPYDHTADRSGEVQQNVFQSQYKAFLDENHIPYHVISGDIDARISQVSQILTDWTQNHPKI
jgi:HTH-type transcriptional regulator, transcriptional repressor of NAD biosynthesis genes